MFLKHQGKILALRGLCHKDIICSFTVGQFCAKVVTLIVPLLDYEQSPFILGPSSKTHETHK